MSKYLVTLDRMTDFDDSHQMATEEVIGNQALVTYNGALVIKDKKGLVKAYADRQWTDVTRYHEKDEIADDTGDNGDGLM